MRMFLKVASGAVLALGTFLVPAASTQAGGGQGGGGIGGGGLSGNVVQIDAPSPAGHNYGFLDYYPRNAVIHQGEAVTFFQAHNFTEPHTVTFFPASVPMTPANFNRLFPGANGGPDVDERNGGIGFDVNQHVAAGCGNSPYYPVSAPCSYTGGSALNSGFLPAPGMQYTVRFNVRPGIYHYFCLVHGPDMSGTIQVVAPKKPIPSAASQFAKGQTQYQWGARNAVNFERHLNPGSRSAGGHRIYNVFAGAAYGRVAIDEFIPQNPRISRGDRLNWIPGGFHTVTFPPNAVRVFDQSCEAGRGDTPFRGFLGCANLEVNLNPRGAFPSGPPGRAYSGGFYNSGLLVFPKVRSWAASFPRAGRFPYECPVHAGMDASVSVR